MLDNGKSKIEDSFGRLLIEIPSKKNWFILLFAIFWLGGWFFGLKSAVFDFGIGQTGHSGIDGFMLFWTLGWTAGGLGVIFLIFWGFFGKETIIIENGITNFNKTIFGLGKYRKLDPNQIKNIRLEKIETSIFGGNQWSFWGLGPGKIKLDYGLKTYSFGLSLDDAEANYIIEIITRKLK
jgi:hypothetical protein